MSGITRERSARGPYKPTLILHGGAGSITRSNLPPELYNKYRESLLSYLSTTNDLLQSGMNALDAACHAVSSMENDELFNCGRGSVFNELGDVEMEASLMVAQPAQPKSVAFGSPDAGADAIPGLIKKNAAVSMIKHTRHPILLAREVLIMADHDEDDDNYKVQSNVTPNVRDDDNSCRKSGKGDGDGSGDFAGKGNMHGHLSGSWVEEWGFKHRGLERKSKKYFWTRHRWEEHRRGLGKSTSDREWKRKLGEVDDEVDGDTSGMTHASSHRGTNTVDDTKIQLDGRPDTQVEHIVDVRELPSQGTVGAVCMDSWGNLCVATSTGGLTNKKAGRIGDTPTVGAGFWAESWMEDVASESEVPSHITPERPILEQFTNTIANNLAQTTRVWLGDCLPQDFSSMTDSKQEFGRTAYSGNSSLMEYLRKDGKEGSTNGPPQYALISTQPNTAQNDSMMYPSFSTRTQNHKVPCTQPRVPKNSLQIANARKQARATALSGTGNGDSFLRLVATRTASSIARYSSSASSSFSSTTSGIHNPQNHTIPLQQAITRIAGPNGALQQSAGPRWGKTGEGEGGMIGIEVIQTFPSSSQPNSESGSGASINRAQNVDLTGHVVYDFNCGGMWRAFFDPDPQMGKPKVMVFREDY